MKIRILTVLLAMLMLFSMVACNNGGGTDETTASQGGKDDVTDSTGDTGTGDETTAQPDVDPLSHLPNDTYGNDEFSILFNHDYRCSNAIILDELGAEPTSVERAVYTRMTYISDTYQIKFQGYKAADYNTDLISKMSTYAKTGIDSMDLCLAHGRHATFPLAVQGSLYEWHDMPLVDLDASYWSQNAREQLATPGGKVYFLTGDANYLTVGTAFCMFFNKDMIGDINGLDMPFDAVREGEWTLEMFETYVATVASNLNGNGTGELGSDSFAYVVISNRGPQAAINCTDYGMLARDEGEKYGYKYTGKKTDVTRAIIDYVELVLKSGNALYYKLSKQEDKFNVHNAFISETVCFFEDEVDYAGTFAKTDVSFGVLPWPMYSEECENGYTSLVDAGVDMFCVLINTSEDNLKRVSVVLENLSYFGQRDVMPLYYETVLSYQYLKDEDSLEMLTYIHDSLVYDFAFFYNPGGIGDAAMSIVNAGGNQSLTSWLTGAQGMIDEALKKWSDLDKEA
ncbi:MAG: hypothetical protein IJX62_06345 [Clostridia bacterium]|nr:hypothetical protein [Clostridia bacterium]